MSKSKKQEFLDSITKEDLEDLYINKDLSASAIANKYNTHTDYVCQALTLYGIPKKISQRQQILNIGKAKTSKFYENAISTWTKRDTLKLKTAKENNLNYVVYYNYNWQFESGNDLSLI